MKFDWYCGRLRFFADVNGDGRITITDVIGWAKFLYFAPAQLVMALFDEAEPLRRFFETDCSTGTSFGGAVFSLFVWLMVWAFAAVALAPARTKV
jgi:hypothetical protein